VKARGECVDSYKLVAALQWCHAI